MAAIRARRRDASREWLVAVEIAGYPYQRTSEFGRNQPESKTRVKCWFLSLREYRSNQQKSLLYDLGAGGRRFKSSRFDQLFKVPRLRSEFRHAARTPRKRLKFKSYRPDGGGTESAGPGRSATSLHEQAGERRLLRA